jgi:hypothetical protein
VPPSAADGEAAAAAHLARSIANPVLQRLAKG